MPTTLETTNLFADRRAFIGRSIQTMLNKPLALNLEERDRFAALNEELRSLEPLIEKENRTQFERDYNRVFARHLRFGSKPGAWGPGVSPDERKILEKRDMATAGQAAYPGATSGFLASMEFNAEVTSAMKYFGGVVSTCTFFETTTGTPRPFPVDNDTTSVGEMLPEATQMTAEDVPIGQTILNSYRFDSKIIKVSNELLLDTGFDFPAYLTRRLAIRLARIYNYVLTNGSGSNQPLGLTNAAAVGAVAVGSSGNTGFNDGSNTVGSADLAALEGSVDPSYRIGAAYMMSSGTLAYLRALLDKSGRPIFLGLHEGPPNSVLNYPVVLNDDMDQLQTEPSSPPVTRKTVAFGKFDQYICRRAPLWVYQFRERWAEYFQTGFACLQRADGSLIDGGGGAVKLLTNVY